MDRKKELKQIYKETKPNAGVFQIKNLHNQKVFLKGIPNLKTINGQKFQLENNSHMNKLLQVEWNQFGPEAFVFEVLEVLKQQEDDFLDPKTALKKLEKKWLDQLQPYGERGYN